MIIQAKVKTGARTDSVVFDKAAGLYVVNVKARPIEGEANKAVQKLLASALDIPISQIRLKTGAKSHLKLFEY